MSRSKKNKPIRVLIDGYNLIFTCGLHGRHRNAASLARARRRLHREIRTNVPAEELMAIWVVYDSTQGNANSNEPVEEGPVATFAAEFDEADAMIEALIARSSIPKSLVVVSADNRIQTAARRRGCQVIASEDWYDRLLSGRFSETSFDLDARRNPDQADDQDLAKTGKPDDGATANVDASEATCALMDPAEIQELLEDVQQLENIDLLDPELLDLDELDEIDVNQMDIDDDLFGFE